MGLTFREVKGSPLTFKEMDDNFRFFTGSYTNTGTISGSFAGVGDELVINPQRILANATSSFNMSDLIDGRSQSGLTILVENGSSNINITCDSAINVNYQRLGTGKITFVAGSGRTLSSPQGNELNNQYEGANLSFSGSNNIMTKGGALFFLDNGDPEIRSRVDVVDFAENTARNISPQLSASGNYLKVTIPNERARSQDYWFDFKVALNEMPGDPASYKYIAKRLIPGAVGSATAYTFYASGDEYLYLQVKTKLDNIETKNIGVDLIAEDGAGVQHDRVIFSFPKEQVAYPLPTGSTIPLITDFHTSSLSAGSSSVVFGVPFAAGQLWDEKQVSLETSTGSPIEFQREVTGKWIESGSIQWVQFRAMAASSSQYVVKISGSQVEAPTGTALITSSSNYNWTMSAGDYTINLGTGSNSPITSITKGNELVASSSISTKGLYLIVSDSAPTASGQLAQFNSSSLTSSVESIGPISSCIKFEGYYVTSGGLKVAKNITRLESHKEKDGINISHTLVFTEPTNNIWFKEAGWELETPQPNIAIFNTTTSSYETVRTSSMSSLNTASIVQESFKMFGYSAGYSDYFCLKENGTTVLTGSAMGDWGGYITETKEGLIWGVQDAHRQHPKEIRINKNGSKGKINLLLYSSGSGSIGELDFRNSTCYDRWQLEANLPFNGVTSASFATQKSNAQGWSKTTELLLLPVSSSYSTSSIGAEVSRLANPVFGFTDPDWIYNSKAMGNLHPYDSSSFNLAEKMIDGTVKLFYNTGNQAAQVLSGSGVFNSFYDYYAGPYYGFTDRYRLTYTLLHDVWLLAARNGLRTDNTRRNIRRFAEGANRAFRDNYFCHHSETPSTSTSKKKGLYIGTFNDGAGNMPMYWEDNVAYNLATTTSLMQLIWDYQLSGNRRSKEVAVSYGEGIKNHLTYTSEHSRIFQTAKSIAQVYQLTEDPDLLLALKKLTVSKGSYGPFVYDPETYLLLAKDRTYDSTTYKTQTDVGGMINVWEITGMDVWKQMSLRTAEFWNNTYMGKNPFHRIAGNYKSFLYYQGNKKSIASIVDLCFRAKNTKYDENTGETTSVGYSVLDPILGGMAYDMDVVSKSKADTMAVTSFLDYNSYGNNNPVFIKKGNNTPKINLYARYSSDFTGSNSFTYTHLRNTNTPSNRLPYGEGFTTTNNRIPYSDNAFNITLNKDLGSPITSTDVYKFQPQVKDAQFIVADSTASMVFRNDGYWLPSYVRPAYRYYFNYPTSSLTGSIFFEDINILYDPTGSIFSTQSGSIDLTGEMSGNWYFIPNAYNESYPSLVSSSGIPPYFTINSSSFWFDPLEALNATTASSVYSDIAVSPQTQISLVPSTRGAYVSASGLHASGGLTISQSVGGEELFSNVSGTLEFYMKTDWSTFTFKSDPTVTYDPTPYPEYYKRFLRIHTSRSNDNNNWRIQYQMYPQGTTLDDGIDGPDHSFYAQNKYYDGFGSGSNTTDRGNRGKFNIIEANQWTHIAYTWDNQVLPALYINGKKYKSSTTIPSEYLPGDEPESINFPCDLKGYITHLRVSKDVIYNDNFTPPSGATPYGFTSGSTLFYLPLSSSQDLSYQSSGSKTINVLYVTGSC